jgi:uncharacterized phage protein (TIGR02218 family)
MTFAAYETSAESGQPIELYEFLFGSTYYRYTSNSIDVVIAGATFTATPISRNNLMASKDDKQGDRLQVTVPGNNLLIQNYTNIVPGKRTTLTLYQMHRNDPALETIIAFKGQVQSVKFNDNYSSAQMEILPITAAQVRLIPRETYQNLCNHMLYDGRCQVPELSATWRKTLTVLTVVNTVLTVPGAGACGSDFFVGGYVLFQGDYRLVAAQDTDDLTLLVPFSVSPVGQIVIVQAGCKHRLIADCQTKFSNVANFGGFPFVPLKNPFNTGI